ncbi:hypothetical protein LRD18_12880, partial [Halorhodospira halochloris]|uniref:hypothetical protein n=1 Tax=Halorhodospira halochloris TaxID=1052 RepID=UPI001EE8443B
ARVYAGFAKRRGVSRVRWSAKRGINLSDLLCDVLQGVGKIAASRRGRKGHALFLVELDGFVYNGAEFRKNLFLVEAVATPIN